MTDLPEPTEDELIEILKPWDWADFEDTISGNKKLFDVNVLPGIFEFKLRVGYFLQKPMRVIIACGKYIRMKNETAYLHMQMLPLDPKNPDCNLYPTFQPDIPTGWRPAVNLYTTPGPVQVSSSMAGLHGLQWNSNITGGGGAGGYSTGGYSTGLRQAQYTVSTTTSVSTPVPTPSLWGGITSIFGFNNP